MVLVWSRLVLTCFVHSRSWPEVDWSSQERTGEVWSGYRVSARRQLPKLNVEGSSPFARSMQVA